MSIKNIQAPIPTFKNTKTQAWSITIDWCSIVYCRNYVFRETALVHGTTMLTFCIQASIYKNHTHTQTHTNLNISQDLGLEISGERCVRPRVYLHLLKLGHVDFESANHLWVESAYHLWKHGKREMERKMWKMRGSQRKEREISLCGVKKRRWEIFCRCGYTMCARANMWMATTAHIARFSKCSAGTVCTRGYACVALLFAGSRIGRPCFVSSKIFQGGVAKWNWS
jgi:hypothetical protein